MEQLFNRAGTEVKPNFGTPEKPIYRYVAKCSRCGGAGQAEQWRHTGLVCFACRGSGRGPLKEERLYTAKQLAAVNKAASSRAARKAEADRVAAEQAEAALVAKEAAFRSGNANFIAKLETLDGDYWEGFKRSFYARRETPTERQIALVEGEVAKRAANAASDYLGNVGDKVTLTLTVERIIVLEGYYGTNYITIARTPEGNVVTYKGLTNLGAVGETTTVKATIKGHDEYNGTRQTVIQRPKVLA